MVEMDYTQLITHRLLNTESEEIIKIATWALCNLSRGQEIDIDKQKCAVSAFAKVIVDTTHNIPIDTIKEALDGLKNLISYKDNAFLIESGVIDRLYQLCQIDTDKILPGTVSVLSHVSYGGNEDCMVIITSGFLDVFYKILQKSDDLISVLLKQDVLWILSNLTVCDDQEIIQKVIGELDHFKILMNYCFHGKIKVRKEAIWTLCNVTLNGSNDQMNSLVQHGIFKMFQENLRFESDPDIIKTVLEATENILTAGAEQGDKFEEVYLDLMENNFLFDRLEQLLKHENTDIYKNALRVIENFCDTEDDI